MKFKDASMEFNLYLIYFQIKRNIRNNFQMMVLTFQQLYHLKKINKN